ncbi:MAG: 1-acyl-sn-glycerol-3-phosphate acyltransferase [Saprospiraceae bacterium]
MRLPYRFVRPLARIALKTYFSKIYLNGLEKIPADKPIILAANHPSAFLEPCILATTLPRPLRFMVKGSLFQKPIYRYLLMSLHMIPMYRLKDIGIKGVKNNFSSLDYSYDLLKNNEQILILAEGTTKHEKRLRTLQKGTARMALGAVEKYPELDVQIIPIGVNYADILNYRSEVMLQIGDPIPIQEYLKGENEHPAKIIKKVTQKLKESLAALVIHIDQQEDEFLCEGLFDLYKNNYPTPNFPVQSTNEKPLKRSIGIANKVNNLPLENKARLAEKIKKYQANLIKHQLVDEVIVQPHSYHPLGIIGILFGVLPFIMGWLFNILPIKFGKYLAEHKVKSITFYASIKASMALAAYIIYFPLLLLVALFSKSIFLIIFVGMIPFLGFFALQFYEYVQKWKEGRQFYQTDSTIINDLKTQRKIILREFEKI